MIYMCVCVCVSSNSQQRREHTKRLYCDEMEKTIACFIGEK